MSGGYRVMKKEENPLKSITDKLILMVKEADGDTKKLANIICTVVDLREGLLEPGGLPENDWWAEESIRNFTKIIVEANYIATTKINPDLEIPSLEIQIEEALEELEPF